MAVELNHTIVPARDALTSASFLAEILGLGAPVRFGPFWNVTLADQRGNDTKSVSGSPTPVMRPRSSCAAIIEKVMPLPP